MISENGNHKPLFLNKKKGDCETPISILQFLPSIIITRIVFPRSSSRHQGYIRVLPSTCLLPKSSPLLVPTCMLDIGLHTICKYTPSRHVTRNPVMSLKHQPIEPVLPPPFAISFTPSTEWAFITQDLGQKKPGSRAYYECSLIHFSATNRSCTLDKHQYDK